ncbi:MAG: hypothetical protein JRI45_11870 [Deltaproteobacteria bacterium]|nr:hypothetical protein [Deltaproteobacteria bacterium]MBW2069579.1 hypothetical protein [Deltaproteobacteria bacterium]
MKPVAVFWDQSLLWGLLVYDALCELEVPFQLLTSEDIKNGELFLYDLLLVPGGWSVHKTKNLGKEGERVIREFLSNGGIYIGFCGGAGMAITGRGSLNIVPVERLPLKERLPSASGKVIIKKTKEHPFWQNGHETLQTSVWWPAQFLIRPQKSPVTIIAKYHSTSEGFWTSDIPYDKSYRDHIKHLEPFYGINLDPEKYLVGRPAIIEYRYNKGKLFLSYPHLETPGDRKSRLFLKHLIEIYSDTTLVKKNQRHRGSRKIGSCFPSKKHLQAGRKILEKVDHLIEFGKQHLLWFWRLPWLLGWKRGVRGLEYSMLYTCVSFLCEGLSLLAANSHPNRTAKDVWSDRLLYLDKMISEFCSQARHLLFYERLATTKRIFSKLDTINREIEPLRKRLFGTSMNHGGMCKEIFDVLDKLLLDTIRLLENQKLRVSLS